MQDGAHLRDLLMAEVRPQAAYLADELQERAARAWGMCRREREDGMGCDARIINDLG